MKPTANGGFSEGLLQFAQANARGPAAPTAPAPAPAAPKAIAPEVAALPPASLEEIAECAALLARMATLAMKAGPSQKMSSGHATQLARRLELMLQSAGFVERDKLWESLMRPGSPSPNRFLAPLPASAGPMVA